MPIDTIVALTSSASVVSDKRDPNNKRHFRWDSIRTFIVLSNTFASSLYTFDLFSKVSNRKPSRIFEFVFAQIFVGMGYLFMDSFIKQYTRKIDGYRFLNPLLSGVGYGQILQTALSCILASNATADALRFITVVLKKELPWSVCPPASQTCVPVSTILDRCIEGKRTDLNVTSEHFFYEDSFIHLDRNAISTKTFVMGVIWIFNFTAATLSNDNVLKFFQLIFIFKTLSTIVVVLVLLIYLRNIAFEAFSELVVFEVKWSMSDVISQMSYIYGVGFVPFYDFGAVSPYTMVDTAIILASLYFTVFSMLRSWIIKIIHLSLIRCVKAPRSSISQHFLFFCVFPLGAEFVRAQKLYLYFLYMNMILSTFGHLVLMTVSVAKILQSKFRSVKFNYFSGIISCVGFILSLLIAVALHRPEWKIVLTFALTLALLCVGALKSTIVMWIYGMERFCADVNYCLGFKPTKFWKLTWALMPIMLFITIFRISRRYIQDENRQHSEGVFSWVAVTVFTVAFFNIKTAIKFLLRNDLAGLLRASIKYGPPDPSDRRSRRNYSETIALRRCKHNCQVVDELFDCNHMPIIIKNFSKQSVESSTVSLVDIYHNDDRRRGSTRD